MQRKAWMASREAPQPGPSVWPDPTDFSRLNGSDTGALSTSVQRRATTNAIDAPRAESVRDERTTIDAHSAAGPGAQSHELDASKADSLSENRATIAPDAESAPGPLTPARAARAASRNPALVARHGISAADVGTAAAPGTAAFAQAVAGFQQQQGLAVDGIVGPKTAAAVRGSAGVTAETDGGAAADSGTPGDIDARGAGSSLLQMKAGPEPGAEEHVHHAATAGISGSAQPLPYVEHIQESFGAHDITAVKAHVGGPATGASAAMGAVAYATGDHVAFAQSPDLHTAAHEAAHVVQQRGGVQLKGGVGQAGDGYEQHADAVADLVVRGESAEALLSQRDAPSSSSVVVQRNSDGATPELRAIGRAKDELGPLARAEADSSTSKLTGSVEATAANFFSQRIEAINVVQSEIEMPAIPSSPEAQSFALQCAGIALALVGGPIAAKIAGALNSILIPGDGPGMRIGAVGPKSPGLTGLISTGIGSAMTAASSALRGVSAGEESPGSSRPANYGSMAPEASEEMAGKKPASSDPQLSFFSAQRTAIKTAQNNAKEHLEEISAAVKKFAAEEPQSVQALQRVLDRLNQLSLDDVLQMQANATMAQWMSFRAQIRHGSTNVDGQWAADLSGGDANPTSVVNIRVRVNPRDLNAPPVVVGASYSHAKGKAAQDRIRTMDLQRSGAPVQIRDTNGWLSIGYSGPGAVWCEPSTYLKQLGRYSRHVPGANPDVPAWDTKYWERHGAVQIADMVLARPLSDHGIETLDK